MSPIQKNVKNLCKIKIFTRIKKRNKKCLQIQVKIRKIKITRFQKKCHFENGEVQIMTLWMDTN